MDEHHLYEIVDQKTDTVFKYGICGRRLTKDGSSPRANEQVNLFNRLAGWARYFASIILTGIPGRKKQKKSKKNTSNSLKNSMVLVLMEILKGNEPFIFTNVLVLFG